MATTLVLVENKSVPLDRRVWPECQALVRAGFEVVVVCPRGTVYDRGAFEYRDGVEIHRYPLHSEGRTLPGYVREYGQAFWHTARAARRLAASRHFDVVHACNPPDLLLAAVWPLKRSGARFIFDHHDLVPELYASRAGRATRIIQPITFALERLSFSLADVVIATNESFRSVAIERGRKAPEDVFVVRNGPDASRFRPVEPDPSLKRGKPHLISYVGLMSPQDGTDHALRALAELASARRDWHAVFVGDGDSYFELRRVAQRLGLDRSVEFTGFVNDDDWIVRLLSTSDVCLAPEPKNSLNDRSTLMKVAEYMATARPVVAFDLSETRFTAGDAAVYAEPNDYRSFARCIGTLLQDPERRRRMGEIGRSRVEQLLSWQHSERRLLEAYDRALSLGGRVRA